jgi:hypothetical protein
MIHRNRTYQNEKRAAQCHEASFILRSQDGQGLISIFRKLFLWDWAQRKSLSKDGSESTKISSPENLNEIKLMALDCPFH